MTDAVELDDVTKTFGPQTAVDGLTLRVPDPAIDDWLGRLGLAGHDHKKVAALSKGMSQKVQFIATVLARPALVLLDEPFSGLDPVNAEVLREAILGLRQSGGTVVFSTHDM